MKKALFLLTILSFIFQGASYSQSIGYHIKLQVDGLKDTTVFLGYYNGESTLVKDTAQVSSNGSFRFEGKDTLPQGVYFLAMGKNKVTRIFEMVIGQTQTFSLATETTEFVKYMQVSGDLDNKLFVENMVFNDHRNKEIEPHIKIIQDSSVAENKKREARKQFKFTNHKVLAFQD